MRNNFDSIKNELTSFINKFKVLSIRQRQALFLQCIMSFDKTFFDYLMNSNEDAHIYYSEVLRYGYPIFIRNFYDKDFETLDGIGLTRITPENQEICQKILWSCKTLGWIEYIEENKKYNNFSVCHFGNTTRVKFKKKHHWNEYLEKNHTLLYSKIIRMAHQEEYEELEKEKPRILEKMRSMVYVWNNYFMGYNNDLEVEEYFRAYAELDEEEETDWDMFQSSDTFGNVKYYDFVQTITDFAGYAIKHIHFAYLLKQANPDLILENFFYLCKDTNQIKKLISENRTISLDQVDTIFKCLSLGAHNIDLFSQPLYCTVPFIKLSKTQAIQSVIGTLYTPFSFMLENLNLFFQKEWSGNTKNRETLFKKELYSIFKSDNFFCNNNNVIISSGGQQKTDIDAVVIDKTAGEIALFQLKWQAHTYVSARSLNSKSLNYNAETKKWLDCVRSWLSSASEGEMSSLLGVKKKFINKNKVYLFVLGRQHGNYSGDKNIDENCAWAQWYQFLAYSQILNKDQPTISQIYELLRKKSPFKQRIIEKPAVQKIGEYKIIFGNWKLL